MATEQAERPDLKLAPETAQPWQAGHIHQRPRPMFPGAQIYHDVRAAGNRHRIGPGQHCQGFGKRPGMQKFEFWQHG